MIKRNSKGQFLCEHYQGFGFKKGNQLGKQNKGNIPWNKGIPMTMELKQKLLEANRRDNFQHALGNRFKHTKEAREKISISHRLIKAEKTSNWKGGITPINQAIRNSIEYKQWRKAVFERDKYTCLICGQVGGELNAHHIKPFNKFPELRFVVSNGVTMCIKCHKLNRQEEEIRG